MQKICVREHFQSATQSVGGGATQAPVAVRACLGRKEAKSTLFVAIRTGFRLFENNRLAKMMSVFGICITRATEWCMSRYDLPHPIKTGSLSNSFLSKRGVERRALAVRSLILACYFVLFRAALDCNPTMHSS